MTINFARSTIRMLRPTLLGLGRETNKLFLWAGHYIGPRPRDTAAVNIRVQLVPSQYYLFGPTWHYKLLDRMTHDRFSDIELGQCQTFELG